MKKPRHRGDHRGAADRAPATRATDLSPGESAVTCFNVTANPDFATYWA